MDRNLFQEKLNSLPLKQAHIRDNFWSRYQTLVTQIMLPYQYEALHDRAPGPPSRCIRNLRIAAGLEEGTFEGFVFQDSDLAKWLEAAAYSLCRCPDSELEARADALIDLIGQAQDPDGYLDSYFTILHPGKQFCNLKEGHELYTMGHFMEAAAAYFHATGKRKFLDLMCRCADHICQVFRQPDYAGAVPGHEEIELALCRLADASGREEYRDMALEFVNRRGTTDYLSREHTLERFVDVWHDANPYLPEYGQAHRPVREQDTAEGHAVRALYLYSAMADLAQSYLDEGLLRACERLYDNITQKRMYVTGGVGSSGTLERFTTDYDLPNDTAYAESCASVALALFCRRMAQITRDAKYMDTAELALMNTVLAGMSLDGKKFFYVNPLETVPAACLPGTDKAHVKPERQSWFGCACCPPNIARTLESLGDWVVFQGERSLWLNLWVGGTYTAGQEGKPVRLDVTSGLPWEGRAGLTLTAGTDLDLMLRLPDYAESPRLTLDGAEVTPAVEKGYARLPLEAGEHKVELRFEMPPRLLYANPNVPADAGKCVVRRGPLVYCLEQADNGENLAGLLLDPAQPITEEFRSDLPGGVVMLTAQGLRSDREEFGPSLYRTGPPGLKPARLVFLPYCLWGNRGTGEMAVWVRYIPDIPAGGAHVGS